ncbi:hypothetical protein [Persephonella sp.]|uniref:hypothetical protein n=1 Tax=Persephonella sp. TaxID=2060922 RepID=UPI002607AB6D|nr:hypothetical protein [Persephonella sp.]
MFKKIFLCFIFLLLISLPSKTQETFFNEGLTENQVYNIKVYTTRALNLVLDAYSSLSKKRIIKKESYAYLDGSLFFLNEAYQYSPTYTVKRQIEALIKRIKFYPDENYSTDIRVLIVQIEEVSANLKDFDRIRNQLDILREYASKRKNDMLKDKLKEIERQIKIPLIDDPILESRYLIGVAKDHLKAREYKKSRQALELALSPLIKLSSRENLYVALSKEYVYKARYTYKVIPELSKRYLELALYNINKAYLVSTEENREILRNIKDKLGFYIEKYESYSITEEDFDEITGILSKI